MDEYAVRVYTLVNHSIKLDALESKERAIIASLANADQEAFKNAIKMFDDAAADPVEKFLLSEQGEGLEELSNLFGG